MKLFINGFEIEATPGEAYDFMQLVERRRQQGSWIENAAADPEPAAGPENKPVKLKSKKKDIGKILALRKAGWTTAKIADEFNVSIQTIRNWMKEAEA